jgi:hypothetical protein
MEKKRIRAWGVRRVFAAAQISILMSAACASLGIVHDEKERPLAEMIHGRRRIQVITPAGKAQVLKPMILADGIGGLSPGFGQAVTYPWTEIRSVQVRKGGIAKRLSVGAGAGLAMGLAAGVILHKPSEGEFDSGIVLLGGIAGTAVGALTGALAGSLFHGWKTVYWANGGSRPVPAFSLAPARGGGLALTLGVGF